MTSEDQDVKDFSVADNSRADNPGGDNNARAVDFFAELPFDLSLRIMDYLCDYDLFRARMVSRLWYKMVTSAAALSTRLINLSHFDLEPLLPADITFPHHNMLPSPELEGEEDLPSPAAGRAGHEGAGADSVATPLPDAAPDIQVEEDRACRIDTTEDLKRLESARDRWLHDDMIVEALYRKVLNREKRWREASPVNRVFLPPPSLVNSKKGKGSSTVPAPERTYGAVKTIKLKRGILCVSYTKGTTIAVWDLLPSRKDWLDNILNAGSEGCGEDEAHQHVGFGGVNGNNNLNILERDRLLEYVNSDKPERPALRTITARYPIRLFDFLPEFQTLVTVCREGDIEVYDLDTCERKRVLVEEGTRVTAVHVWDNYLVVGCGTQVSVWNYRTGERLTNKLHTWHRGNITGTFILDNDDHILSVDETGAIGITSRSSPTPHLNPLLVNPLYPLFLHGELGAPYQMRLLHSTHLCVWGKSQMGQYELLEPNKPNPYVMYSESPEQNQEKIDAAMRQIDQIYDAISGANYQQMMAARQNDEDRPARREVSHNAPLDLSRLSTEQLRNRVDKKERYTLVEMDPRISESMVGQTLVVDFRHIVTMDESRCIRIYELDCTENFKRGRILSTWPAAVTESVIPRSRLPESMNADKVAPQPPEFPDEGYVIDHLRSFFHFPQERHADDVARNTDDFHYAAAPFPARYHASLKLQKQQEARLPYTIIDYDENIEPLDIESLYKNLQRLALGRSSTPASLGGEDGIFSPPLSSSPSLQGNEGLSLASAFPSSRTASAMSVLRGLEPITATMDDLRLIVGFSNGYVGIYNFV